MTMTDDPRAPTRAEIIAAADQVALKVFFSGVKGEDLTVGVVRDAALETLTEFAAQARAQALEEAAREVDGLSLNKSIGMADVACYRYAARRIRALAAQERDRETGDAS